jgi:RNA polymerase subunit RPABC4/transcription elongation factor Spt4
MDQRVYHGPISPELLARALIAEFAQGNMQAQVMGDSERMIVQIATRQMRASGGQTAMSVHLEKIEDGVLVKTGQQEWLGVAASLGVSALFGLRSPLNLLGRLDDIAQDIASLQLQERVWDVLARAAEAVGAGHDISERLRRIQCAYCGVAVPVGEASCPACGAPLGGVQPRACPRCGHIVAADVRTCPNCQAVLAP